MSTKRKLLVALAVFALVFGGFFYWVWRGTPAQHTLDQLSGKDPVLVEPKSEMIPSISIAKSVGWGPAEAPTAAPGLQVTRFAAGLQHPRVIYPLPNGDVIVAEADAPKGNLGSGLTAKIAQLIMHRAGANEGSPDALVLLRDSNGDGTADQRFVLRQGNGLVSPSGLAWQNGTLYVANHDAVLAFAYQLGETALASQPSKIMDLPGGGNHWMRNLLLSPDGKRLYAAVGSSSNIAERGIAAEAGRAAIWEMQLGKPGRARMYAQGLRNPNGLGWNPSTGELWVVVNERDQLGPDLVPDYLTNVPIGAHYGWPWVWWKTHNDDRVKSQPPEFFDDFVRKPEYALGAHVAPLGLAFVQGGALLGPNYANGAVIARHGSWNRTPLSGYDVVFVKFDANGNPQGLPLPLLGGFLTGKGETHGRPTWVAFAKDGALLVSDDTGGIIWRVTAPGAKPAAGIVPVESARILPQRSLISDPYARYNAKLKNDSVVKQQ